LNVIQVYFQALLAKEQVIVAELQINLIRGQIELAEKRFAVGKMTETDLSQLYTQLSSDSIDLITAKETYGDDLIGLKTIVNIPLSTPFEVQPFDESELGISEIQLDPEEIFQRAIVSQALIKVDRLKEEYAGFNLKSAKETMYPTISLGYNLYSSFSNYIAGEGFKDWWSGYGGELKGDFYQQVSISLNIPIFNNGKARGAYKQSIVELQLAQLKEAQDLAQLSQAIYSLCNEASHAYQKTQEDKSLVEIAQRTSDLIEKAFQIGSKDALSLITSENNLTRAKESALANRFDYFFKKIMLRYYEKGGL
jgi:outer membrane protein